MATNTDHSDCVHTGTHSFTGTCNLPTSSVGDSQANSGDPIDTDKLKHRHAITYYQADGTDVAAVTVPVFIARAACTLVSVEVSCVDACEGGDKTFTVDVQKADAAAAAATVLTTPVTYPAETADYTVRTGTISSATVDDGDTLLVVVAVSGSTGNQGQGLCVTINIDESPT